MSEWQKGSAVSFRYSVVVPIYNEGANIERFCMRARDLPERGEFIFVYDEESDDTLPVLAALPLAGRPARIRTVRNQGRGACEAIKNGLREACAPTVLVMMADLSDDFAVIDEMIQRVEAGADLVSASRYMPGGVQRGGPLLKRLLSRGAGVSLYWLAGLPTHDPTNSFKAYSTRLLRTIEVESTKGFTISLELTVKAHLRGFRVEEIPATWSDRDAGESRFRLLQWLPHYFRWYLFAVRQRWS
jgi:dolichol-phosphate mannosyltransferase